MSPHHSFRLTAKAVAVLLPILGTSWVFGVLAVNNQAVAFQYMFAALNSLQVRARGTPGRGGVPRRCPQAVCAAGCPRAGGTPSSLLVPHTP